MSYWGELYLRSTMPLLSPEVTAREVAYLASSFAPVSGVIADIGCGHGRHVSALEAGVLKGRVVGLEKDPQSLRQRQGAFPVIRGDFLTLPFRAGGLGGAYAWYSTLFVHDDRTNQAVLNALGRSLRPGGRVVLQSVPFERLAEQPNAQFDGELPDGSKVREKSRFDAKTGLDQGERQLTLPDGRELSGSYTIRYYPLPELLTLLWGAGFTLRWAHGDLTGAPPSAKSTDLIVGAEKTHGV